jgi:hypothetical protein
MAPLQSSLVKRHALIDLVRGLDQTTGRALHEMKLEARRQR